MSGALHVVAGVQGEGFLGHLSLWEEIKEKLPGRAEAELTRKQAFEVLEKIDLECQAKAFLSKPIIAIPLTFGAAMLGFVLLESASIIAVIAGFVLSIGGLIAFGASILATIDGSMSRFSGLYAGIAQEANTCRMNMLDDPQGRIHFAVERAR